MENNQLWSNGLDCNSCLLRDWLMWALFFDGPFCSLTCKPLSISQVESPCSIYEAADSFKGTAVESMNGSLFGWIKCWFNDLVISKLCPTPVLGSTITETLRLWCVRQKRDIPFLLDWACNEILARTCTDALMKWPILQALMFGSQSHPDGWASMPCNTSHSLMDTLEYTLLSSSSHQIHAPPVSAVVPLALHFPSPSSVLYHACGPGGYSVGLLYHIASIAFPHHSCSFQRHWVHQGPRTGGLMTGQRQIGLGKWGKLLQICWSHCASAWEADPYPTMHHLFAPG